MTDAAPSMTTLDAEALARALRELLERLDLGYAVKDPASLKYLEVNGRLAGWLGSTPEAMTGTADAQWLEASQWPALRTADLPAHGPASNRAAAFSSTPWIVPRDRLPETWAVDDRN